MAFREFLRLDEVEELLNDTEFLDSLEINSHIDIVQLPPDRVDQLSDSEEIDENDIDTDCIIHDVPGRIEVHNIEKEDQSHEDQSHEKEDQSHEDQSQSQADKSGTRTHIEPSTPPTKRRKRLTAMTSISEEHTTNTRKNQSHEDQSQSQADKSGTRTHIEPSTPPTKRRKRLTAMTSISEEHTTNTRKNSTTKVKKIHLQKKKPRATDIPKWVKTEPHFILTSPSEVFQDEHRKKICEELNGKSPVEIFETLFDEELMQHIVDQSCIYATQNNRHDFELTIDCLKKFLGVLLFSGYHSLPQENLYWCEDEDISTDCVRKCISRHRWLEIKRNLHFHDNNKIPSDNSAKKSIKISPLYEILNKNFCKFGIFSRNLSIDEQMVRYYGHHFLKQFIRGKPIRFGFKQWALCCGETGYLFHTELYEGRQAENEVREMPTLGASVIMKKVHMVDNPWNHSFYFDNFFTSYALMKKLTEMEVCATGTAQLRMMNKCPMKSDNIMKKEERGTYDYAFDTKSKVLAISWKDNNNVKVMSNNAGIHPVQKVNRWSKTEKKQVKVDQPNCVANYNKSMGGVDKMDWLVNKYRMKIKGKKWYFPIFTYLVDTAIVNAHILYCMTNRKVPLLDFRRSVTRTYLSKSSISDPGKAGRPSLQKQSRKRVEEAVRIDPVGHVIQRTDGGKQRKCAVCKKNARKQCGKCNVGLHVDCFPDWHKK